MKQLLIALIVLSASVSAGATVLVYNVRAVNTGIKYDFSDVLIDAQLWMKYTEPYGGYLIAGPGSTDEKLSVRVIWTEKIRGSRYFWEDNWGEVNLMKADIFKFTSSGLKINWVWILSSSNQTSRTHITGDSKAKMIGNHKSTSCLGCHLDAAEMETIGDIDPNIPATLTGYSMSDVNETGSWPWFIDHGTKKITAKLNTKKTLQYHMYNNAEDVKNGLADELDFAGYNHP